MSYNYLFKNIVIGDSGPWMYAYLPLIDKWNAGGSKPRVEALPLLPPCARPLSLMDNTMCTNNRRGQVVPAPVLHRQALPARARPHHRCVRWCVSVRCVACRPPTNPTNRPWRQSLSDQCFIRHSLNMCVRYLRRGVRGAHDQHRWEADQAADLGHGASKSRGVEGSRGDD